MTRRVFAARAADVRGGPRGRGKGRGRGRGRGRGNQKNIPKQPKHQFSVRFFKLLVSVEVCVFVSLWHFSKCTEFIYKYIYIFFYYYYIYIYIYAFSRRFYPNVLGYTFSLVCVFPGNRTHNLLRCWRNALPLSHTGTHYYYNFFFVCIKATLYTQVYT